MHEVPLWDVFWLRKHIHESGKYVSEITEINPSQKCITSTHSSNEVKINFGPNSQYDHFCKMAAEL